MNKQELRTEGKPYFTRELELMDKAEDVGLTEKEKEELEQCIAQRYKILLKFIDKELKHDL